MFEIRIVRGVVSKDHVHMLVSAPPNLAPSEIMRRIKGRTSSYLFQEFPHLKKRYWGRHFWARGYFCATVGQMTEEMIKQYLEDGARLRRVVQSTRIRTFSPQLKPTGFKPVVV